MRDFIQHLCDQGFESEVIEFKEAKNSYDFNKLGKYFSALSNEANLQGKPQGWLLFGVSDQGKAVVGSQFRPDESSLMSLKGEIAKQTTINLTFSQIRIEMIDGKRVILFEIPAAPKGIPIGWKGHFYGRDHDELGALHINELESIRDQVVQSERSAGICCGASLDDIDSEALAKASLPKIQNSGRILRDGIQQPSSTKQNSQSMGRSPERHCSFSGSRSPIITSIPVTAKSLGYSRMQMASKRITNTSTAHCFWGSTPFFTKSVRSVIATYWTMRFFQKRLINTIPT